MERPELSLDHLALLVRRLGVAAAAYEKLGFTLSPLSVHEVPLEPGGQTTSWGTASRCVMLRDGYLELIAARADTEYSRIVTRRAASREGIHLVALGTSDLSAACKRLAGDVAGLEPVTSVTREWPVGSTTRPASFRMAHLDGRVWPEADLTLIEHRTPQLLWQPEWTDHPNGAIELASVTITSDQPVQSRRRFESLLGPARGLSFKLQRGSVMITDLVSLVRRYPGISSSRAPFPAAIGIKVDDLQQVQDLLLGNHVPFQVSPSGTVWVDPVHGGGAIVEFLV